MVWRNEIDTHLGIDRSIFAWKGINQKEYLQKKIN